MNWIGRYRLADEQLQAFHDVIRSTPIDVPGIAFLRDLSLDLSAVGQALADVEPAVKLAFEKYRLEVDRTLSGQVMPYHGNNLLLAAAILRIRLKPYTTSREQEWCERTELAFLHLNRTIVANDGERSRWRAAWGQNEPALERLGGVHLLSHGLFGFKASAAGQQTDLVLGSLVRRDEAERAGAPLVLTEWKKAAADDAEEKTRAATLQLDSYRAGTMAGAELRRSRYVVLVVEKRLADRPPDRTAADGAAVRVVEVVVDPESASAESARVARQRG